MTTVQSCENLKMPYPQDNLVSKTELYDLLKNLTLTVNIEGVKHKIDIELPHSTTESSQKISGSSSS